LTRPAGATTRYCDSTGSMRGVVNLTGAVLDAVKMPESAARVHNVIVKSLLMISFSQLRKRHRPILLHFPL
jgi:hypothetical protein